MLSQHANDWLGKRIEVAYTYATEEAMLQDQLTSPDVFVGVIKSISQSRGSGASNTIIMRGQSLSGLLDDAPHTRSFTDMGLQEIVDTVLADYSSQLEHAEECAPSVEPRYQEAIPYLVQYKETNYSFLCRIAAEYGEWFFYDGKRLLFGKPVEADPIPLCFGQEDVFRYELTLRAFPVMSKFRAYDYKTHDFPETEPTESGELGAYSEVVFNKSKNDIFPNATQWLSPITRGMEEADVTRFANRQQQMRVQQMVVLQGSSGNPHVQVGSTITFEDGQSGDDHGTYIVIGVNHSMASKGSQYYNTFEAVPVEVSAPPIGSLINLPFCESQQAKVTDTNDPDGMGRVKVEFGWQKGTDEKSPWIRVATPHMGGDKGIFWVPEIGDVVLVDFEHNDPDHPYVLTGFYHGQAKPAWQDDKNNVKALVTRSGNQILLDDTAGKETITISNPTGSNTVQLTAGKEFSVSINGGKSISIAAKNNIDIVAANINIVATSGNLTLNGKKAATLTGEKTCTVQGKEVRVNATDGGNTTIEGKNVTINGTTETSITALEIKLNS